MKTVLLQENVLDDTRLNCQHLFLATDEFRNQKSFVGVLLIYGVSCEMM